MVNISTYNKLKTSHDKHKDVLDKLEIKHDNLFDGYEVWDLRSYNNQEVAPGLYIYVVESGNAKKIDKFAIIR